MLFYKTHQPREMDPMPLLKMQNSGSFPEAGVVIML